MPLVLGGSGEKYATFTSTDRRQQPVDARIPGDRTRDIAACAAERLRLVDMGAQPRASARDVVAIRCDDEAGLVVAHDVERPACVHGRHDRLLGEERLERDEAVVLVERRVVDAETACVQICELVVGDASRERRAPVEPTVASDFLEAFPIRAVAGASSSRSASSASLICVGCQPCSSSYKSVTTGCRESVLNGSAVMKRSA